MTHVCFPKLTQAAWEVVQTLKDQIAERKLNSEDNAQLQADVQATESQLASPRPNRIVIEACMRSVTNIDAEGDRGAASGRGGHSSK